MHGRRSKIETTVREVIQLFLPVTAHCLEHFSKSRVYVGLVKGEMTFKNNINTDFIRFKAYGIPACSVSPWRLVKRPFRATFFFFLNFYYYPIKKYQSVFCFSRGAMPRGAWKQNLHSVRPKRPSLLLPHAYVVEPYTRPRPTFYRRARKNTIIRTSRWIIVLVVKQTTRLYSCSRRVRRIQTDENKQIEHFWAENDVGRTRVITMCV